MEDEIIPLFAHRDKAGRTVKVVPRVHDDEEGELSASALIQTLAAEVEKTAEGIVCENELGKMTFGGWSLLEILHRVGLRNMADNLLASGNDLRHASLYFTLGMEMGRLIPDGVEIDTEESGSSVNLRDLTESGGEDKEKPDPSGN
jgi:hypothetical protein